MLIHTCGHAQKHLLLDHNFAVSHQIAMKFGMVAHIRKECHMQKL